MPDHHDVDVEARAQTAKRCNYIVDNLPADLPFAAPSYLVKRMEESKTSWFKSIFLVGTKDYAMVLINIVTVLLAVVLSAARTDKADRVPLTGFEIFLRVFATIYPALAVVAILTRANEMTLRKELYYLLMKYKIIIDWDNWTLFGERGMQTRKFYKTIFLWGWIISAALLCIFAWRNVSMYVDFLQDACEQCMSFVGPSGGNLYKLLVLIFILLQLGSFLSYFYSTLQVEETGLVTLNKSIENKETGKFEWGAWTQFLHGGEHEGSEGVASFEEQDILTWAVIRYSQLPLRYKVWNPIPQPANPSKPAIAERLRKWQARAEGDLQCIHDSFWSDEDSHSFAWHDDDVAGNWLAEHLVYRNLWGFCLLKTLLLHPDFHAAHDALVGLAKANFLKVFLSVVLSVAVGGFALYWMW